MSVKGKKIGFLGAGNMGEALIKGLLKTGVVSPSMLFAADALPERIEQIEKLYRIQALPDNATLVKRADVVVLAVKPQVIADVLEEINPAVTPKKLIISIAAGVSTAELRSRLPKGVRVIRVMPNTGALVLEGATAIARASGLEAGDLETAEEIFAAVGKVVVLEEKLMDAVTGLSGSGPAYIAIVIEALADGGVKMGLDRLTATSLAAQTVLGAAKLLLETEIHPGQLKDMVSSPGGTTIAGISALEEGGLRRALINAVERATLRSKELGQGK